MLGLSREATNRILSRLNKTGLITSKYNHIIVPNIEKLKQIIQKDEAE
jgi:CRP-like cAMP-binding protein